jgi:uncharacterized protein YegL
MVARCVRFLTAGLTLVVGCGSADSVVQSGPGASPSGAQAGGADASTAWPDAARPASPVLPVPGGPTPTGGSSDTCLVQPIDVKGQSPDMLIVMDRSLSMAPARWAPSVAAVERFVGAYQATVDFGLSVFPPTTVNVVDVRLLGNVNAPNAGCGVAVLDVPLAPANGQAIASKLRSMQPGGTTPTAAALGSALSFLGPRLEAGPDSARTKPAHVLLVTDGEPNCSPTALDDTRAAAAALLAAGIKVYVVGYDVAAAAETMNAIARAGGTERYYAVENAQDLDAAFQTITQDVVRCEFDLATSEANPDPKYIFVTVDGRELPMSAADGWTVSGRRITLGGTACSTLKDGVIHSVRAELRCTPLR